MKIIVKLLISLPFYIAALPLMAAPTECTEDAQAPTPPANLHVVASEAWEYVLFESECGDRLFLQLDYVADHMPQSMVFELNQEEKAELKKDGHSYLQLLRKVAAYNSEEFIKYRQITDFNQWPSAKTAIDDYIAELVP